MIAHLQGTVIHRNDKYVVLETRDGIGYKVFTTTETALQSALNEPKSLWTHHAIREDASDLFGFPSTDELEFFELLITISGIGPRTALGILNVTTVESLKKAITSGETAHLVKVSGVGKKMADKIVLELKGKVGEETEGGSLKEEAEALEALKALGFNHNAAREALREVSKNAPTETRIKEALKILGK